MTGNQSGCQCFYIPAISCTIASVFITRCDQHGCQYFPGRFVSMIVNGILLPGMSSMFANIFLYVREDQCGCQCFIYEKRSEWLPIDVVVSWYPAC